MKKIKLLKGIALSVSALMVLSLSGCDYINQFLDGVKGGNDSNVTDDDKNSTEPKLTISQTEVTLTVDDEVQLTATASDGSAVTWGVSPVGIVTVADGLVTAVAAGTATVWAATDSLMEICTVKVNPKPIKPDPPADETLELSNEILSLEAGKTATLTATCSVEGATVKWTSSNTTVATVSNGKVTAKTAGKTTVTASVTLSTGDKIYAYCEVTVTTPVGYKPGYELIWNDEFEGTSLDTSKWSYQTGIRDIYHEYDTQVWNWGNDELQTYTQDSVKVSGGSLVITASKLQEQIDNKDYKSGRILTRDKHSWTYGYFEAKMKTPTGNGMWPAFWMLPQPTSYANTENKYGGWPYNGEIDIMEAKGSLYNKVDNTLHFGPREGTWESHFITNRNYDGGYTLSSNTDNWHTYAVDWTANYISWIVDGTTVMTVSSDEWYSRSEAAAGNNAAPFDQPFYILLNLAVGGKYDNWTAPEATFTSKSMYVDYVRVYKKL